MFHKEIKTRTDECTLSIKYKWEKSCTYLDSRFVAAPFRFAGLSLKFLSADPVQILLSRAVSGKQSSIQWFNTPENGCTTWTLLDCQAPKIEHLRSVLSELDTSARRRLRAASYLVVRSPISFQHAQWSVIRSECISSIYSYMKWGLARLLYLPAIGQLQLLSSGDVV